MGDCNGTINLDSMHDEIQETITYTRAFATEAKSDVDDALENLNTLLSDFTFSHTDIDMTVPPLDGPAFPSAPAFPPLSLDDYPDVDLTAPSYLDYGDLDFEFVSPDIPDELSSTFGYNPGTYTSEMWQVLFNKTHADILNGGTGLSSEVYDAIISRGQEASRLNRERNLQTLVDITGANGFDLPSGQIASILLEDSNENKRQEQDAVNNVTVKDFELAQQNTQFAITSGSELEKLNKQTFEFAQKLGLDIEKAATDYVVQVYNANMTRYTSAWEGIKIRFESLAKKIDGIAQYNDGITKVFLGEADVYKTQVEAITSKNTGLVTSRQGEINVYGTEVKAISTQYASLISQAGLNLDSIKLQISSAIEDQKLQLSAYTSKTQLAITVAEGQANIASQSLASALGAINTTLSNSYSGSENRGQSWSCSESHNYEHEG